MENVENKNKMAKVEKMEKVEKVEVIDVDALYANAPRAIVGRKRARFMMADSDDEELVVCPHCKEAFLV